MAWNQPGSGPNKPWGRRPGQGSSNLDDKVKDWQKRLESILRGGGGGGSGGEGRGADAGGSMLALVAGLLVIVWIGSGFFQVNAAERGVIQRFGRFIDARGQGLGWHWPWPIETVTKVNVANVNSSDYKSRVLTADVNLVDLRFAVQYRFANPEKVLFKVRDPEATLREVSESAIRETVGRAQLDQVLVGASRPVLTRTTMDLIQKTLDAYDTGIAVTSVNLTDVQVPEPVIPSQRDANKALADQERLVKEAQAYANGILPVAQGTAARTLQDAEAYRAQAVAIAEGQAARFSQLVDAYAKAPDVTRQRLYIETVENVMSRARKVIVDSKGGTGGNILYLPLDKLMERGATSAEPPQETTIRSSVGDAEATGQDARGRGER